MQGYSDFKKYYMENYQEKCGKPIPIGKQEFAYQCENVALDPVAGAIVITGWIPSKRGAKPYPNEEQADIEHYQVKLSRFTQNAIEVQFCKRMKDGSEVLYLTTLSFSDVVNRLFEDHPAVVYDRVASVSAFIIE